MASTLFAFPIHTQVTHRSDSTFLPFDCDHFLGRFGSTIDGNGHEIVLPSSVPQLAALACHKMGLGKFPALTAARMPKTAIVMTHLSLMHLDTTIGHQLPLP